MIVGYCVFMHKYIIRVTGSTQDIEGRLRCEDGEDVSHILPLQSEGINPPYNKGNDSLESSFHA